MTVGEQNPASAESIAIEIAPRDGIMGFVVYRKHSDGRVRFVEWLPSFELAHQRYPSAVARHVRR
jgi:hypothetical protein